MGILAVAARLAATAALSTLVYPLSFFEAAFVGPGYYVATAVAGVRNVLFFIATVRWFQEQVGRRKVPEAPLG